MTLYELTGELLELLRMAEDPEVDEQMLNDTLESVNMEIEDKADAYAKIMQELEADADKLKGEIERLQARKKTITNNIERIKKSLKESMESTGKTKFKTDLFSFNIAKNGGKAPLILDVPEKDVPRDWCKAEWKPDMDIIRQSIEDGEDIDFAQIGERGTSLRIK